MGWLVVCFDLPVVEKEQMRQANLFRKALLEQGYFNLTMIAPSTGSILAFYITDRQWSLSISIEKSGYKTSKYKKKSGENAEKQMTFW